MFSELGYDRRLFGIFFDKPILLNGELTSGPGGFSRTFFERSQVCTACGACCRNNYQKTWYWFDFVKHPNLPLQRENLIFERDGDKFPVPILLYECESFAKCDFLEGNLCSLHQADLKPTHCLIAPQIGAYHVGDAYWLSKRLPSRNWRHPKCPTVMSETPPPNEAERAADRRILETLHQAFGHIPGCYLSTILEMLDLLYDPVVFYKLSNNRSCLEFKTLSEIAS